MAGELSTPTILAEGQRSRRIAVLLPGPHPRSTISSGRSIVILARRSRLGCVRSCSKRKYNDAFQSSVIRYNEVCLSTSISYAIRAGPREDFCILPETRNEWDQEGSLHHPNSHLRIATAVTTTTARIISGGPDDDRYLSGAIPSKGLS
jgi:hypothetical protein